MPHVDVPHFQLPFRFGQHEGRIEAMTVEQDELDEITGCVETIIRYPIDFRPELPEFGTPEQVFSQAPLNIAEVANAVSEWEPRAQFDISTHIDVDQPTRDELSQTIRILLEGTETE